MFYLVYKTVGFNGLSIFFILLNGLTIFIFFILAKRNSNCYVALFLTLITLPLLSYRHEVRPEVFSYLFLAVYYYVLFLYSKNELDWKKVLITLCVIQLLWVNLHIFFILGPFLVGVFMLRGLVVSRDEKHLRSLLPILLGVVLVNLLNPHGIYGLLEPLNIFKEYGYMIVENQSVFFMQNRFWWCETEQRGGGIHLGNNPGSIPPAFRAIHKKSDWGIQKKAWRKKGLNCF